MSNHRNNEFLGFGATAPPNVLPEWLYSRLFFPPMKTKRGVPVEAPYGLRKVEAKLLDEGFTVLTVDPDHLEPYIEEAKVLGIYVMDPFGLGPASTTFARILNTGETYSAKYFRSLLEKPEVRSAKKRGLKIIIGGPGAWQLRYRPRFLVEHGIDCVLEGEAESVVVRLFRTALDGEELPMFYEVSGKEIPSLEEIPEIKNPSVNGLVEVGRGCVRGCQFCSVTLRPLRWITYEKIEKELRVNVEAGIRSGILHAEDVLLYGSKSITPESSKVLKLHRLAKKRLDTVSWSHTSMAVVASSPKLVKEVAEIILDGRQEWWGVEVGIETGSPRLVRKIMPAKALPFRAEEWPEVVGTAAGIMSDHSLIPACTLMVGVPGETEEDVAKTIELVDDLRGFESLIVPLFFVPMGRLREEEWFRVKEMNPLHEELLARCLDHSLYWAKRILARQYFKGPNGPFLNFLTRLFMFQIERKARELKEELISQ
ncbi:MAG: B12-binding domain-containing radical SAM protein [Candidatus Bathyarchaeia archaeon]